MEICDSAIHVSLINEVLQKSQGSERTLQPVQIFSYTRDSDVYAPIIWMKLSHSGTEWRELCMHLCNCVIHTSWFCVRMIIIRHWGCWGEDRPSVCTVSRQISVDSPQGRNASRLNHTSPPSTCSAQLLIKTAFVEPRTSSTAVDINFKWVVSRERVLPSDRVDSIKRQK